jgi:hypothetical protein
LSENETSTHAATFVRATNIGNSVALGSGGLAYRSVK